MTVVCDSDVIIDFLRGREEAVDVLTRRVDRGQHLAASTMTKVEVLGGMRAGEEPATYDLFATIAWVPVSEAVAERAGDLARAWLRSNPGIDAVDFTVAATAHELDAELLTRNVRHFPMFAGLSAPY